MILYQRIPYPPNDWSKTGRYSFDLDFNEEYNYKEAECNIIMEEVNV